MNDNLISNIKIAVSELKESGFTEEALELESSISTAYSSPSEMVGEIGLSIKSILNKTKQKLPPKTKEKLVVSSKEIGKTWPKLRN